MSDEKLIISRPGEAEQELELSSCGVSIGRCSDNSISIENKYISRYHAVIEKRADGFWLSDLSSSWGTKVNGNPIISERKLQDGDLISIGMSTMLFLSTKTVSIPDKNRPL